MVGAVGMGRGVKPDAARRKIMLRVVGGVVLLVMRSAALVSTLLLQCQIHHLAMVVVMYAHCYQDEDNSKASHDDGQSFPHSATKVTHLFQLCKEIVRKICINYKYRGFFMASKPLGIRVAYGIAAGGRH